MPVTLDNREWSAVLADRIPVGDARGTNAFTVVGWTPATGVRLMTWSD